MAYIDHFIFLLIFLNIFHNFQVNIIYLHNQEKVHFYKYTVRTERLHLVPFGWGGGHLASAMFLKPWLDKSETQSDNDRNTQHMKKEGIKVTNINKPWETLSSVTQNVIFILLG